MTSGFGEPDLEIQLLELLLCSWVSTYSVHEAGQAFFFSFVNLYHLTATKQQKNRLSDKLLSSSFPQKTLSLCSTISFSATSPYTTPMWTVSQKAQRQNRLYLDGQEGEESSFDSTEQDAGHLTVDWLPRSQQYVCLFHTGREFSVGAV